MDHSEGKPVTYYVVQTYSWFDGEIISDEPKQVTSREAARRAIQGMPVTKVGGLSFSRTGNPATGEFEEAVIIAQKGTIPSQDEDFY